MWNHPEINIRVLICVLYMCLCICGHVHVYDVVTRTRADQSSRLELTMMKCLVSAANRGSCTCPSSNGTLLHPNQQPEVQGCTRSRTRTCEWERDRDAARARRTERIREGEGVWSDVRSNLLLTLCIYSWQGQQHRWLPGTKSAGISPQIMCLYRIGLCVHVLPQMMR